MNPTSHPLYVRVEIDRRLEEAQARHRAAAFRSPRRRWWPRRTAILALPRQLPATPRERALPTTTAIDRAA